MKRIILPLFVIFGTITMMGQTIQIPLLFSNVLPSELSTYSFTVGANPTATIGVDSALKEMEIPTLPPPAGVFIVYSVPPTPDFIWLSPRDIRPLVVGEKQLVTYDIGITWTGGRLEIGWGALPRFVDSAYIVDVITEFPNNFIKQKLEPGVVFTTSNSAITKLKVLVWYDATNLSSTKLDLTKEEASVYPNPTAGAVHLKGAESGSYATVMDMTGRIRHTAIIASSNDRVDLTNLEPGVYAVRMMQQSGAIVTTMVVRR